MRFATIAVLPLVAVTGALLLSFIPTIAQDEVPPPYAGMKNPFKWEDKAAQEAGKKLYTQSCVGCHGLKGDGVPTVHFGDNLILQKHLENQPDHHFWVLSEGRLTKGMPPYKSSFSEAQRWQLLTYLWSLASTPAKPTQPPAEGISLVLNTPKEGTAGRPLPISATLKDKNGQPLAGETVKFQAGIIFLETGGAIDIGEAVTDGSGVAHLEYVPQLGGPVWIIAQYQDAKSTVEVPLGEADHPFYRPHVGIELPAPGEEVVFPKSLMQLNDDNSAPETVFRLPGGIISWLLTFAGTVFLVWFTYSRVMYNIFRISTAGQRPDTTARLIPMIGLVFILTLGITLLLMILTGPYSHWHVDH